MSRSRLRGRKGKNQKTKTMERLSLNDDDGEVAARWLSTLEETKRMAARHVADVATAAAARGGDDAWVDVAAGRENDYAPRKQSSSSTSTSITSTSTPGVPRDSGDAWRQEEWHIAFVVLVN